MTLDEIWLALGNRPLVVQALIARSHRMDRERARQAAEEEARAKLRKPRAKVIAFPAKNPQS